MAGNALRPDAEELVGDAVCRIIPGVLYRVSLLKIANHEIRGTDLVRITLPTDHFRCDIRIRAVSRDEIPEIVIEKVAPWNSDEVVVPACDFKMVRVEKRPV